MREFFRGWKRKAGCVTLVLACLLLGGWFRSLNHTDRFGFFSSEYEYHGFASIKANLAWLKLIPSDVSQVSDDLKRSINNDTERLNQIVITREKEVRQVFKQISQLRADSVCKALLVKQDKFEWKWRCFGLEIGIGRLSIDEPFFPCRVTVWKLSYWSLIVPLTALSTWLLLSKSRTKITPPITPASENV